MPVRLPRRGPRCRMSRRGPAGCCRGTRRGPRGRNGSPGSCKPSDPQNLATPPTTPSGWTAPIPPDPPPSETPGVVEPLRLPSIAQLSRTSSILRTVRTPPTARESFPGQARSASVAHGDSGNRCRRLDHQSSDDTHEDRSYASHDQERAERNAECEDQESQDDQARADDDEDHAQWRLDLWIWLQALASSCMLREVERRVLAPDRVGMTGEPGLRRHDPSKWRRPPVVSRELSVATRRYGACRKTLRARPQRLALRTTFGHPGELLKGTAGNAFPRRIAT